jgi:hypothetical protein
MIVIDYANGSILSYKTQDVIGWKKDPEKGIPVIITKGNEVIPVQTDIPVTFPDGRTVNPGEVDFPVNSFPEYEAKEVIKKDDKAQTQNTQVETIQPVENINVREENKVPDVVPPVNNDDKAPPPPPPVSGNTPNIKGGN